MRPHRRCNIVLLCGRTRRRSKSRRTCWSRSTTRCACCRCCATSAGCGSRRPRTELGIAPSTAHRLLAMLVYRGFAVQDEKRMYHPGPAMGAGPAERGLDPRVHRPLPAPHGGPRDLLRRDGQPRDPRRHPGALPVVRRVGRDVARRRPPGPGPPRGIDCGRTDSAGRTARRRPSNSCTYGPRTARRRPRAGRPPPRPTSSTVPAGTVRRPRRRIRRQRAADRGGVAAFGVAIRNRARTAVGAITVSVPPSVITAMRGRGRQMKPAALPAALAGTAGVADQERDPRTRGGHRRPRTLTVVLHRRILYRPGRRPS